MINYCKRCGHNPCICLHSNIEANSCNSNSARERRQSKNNIKSQCQKPPCPVRPCPTPPMSCAESVKRLLLYYVYSDFQCTVFPNTCCNWYKPYYGESPAFPVRYILNQMCRRR